MKKWILIVALIFPFITQGAGNEPPVQDTVFSWDNKRMEVKEEGKYTKVKMFEYDENGDPNELDMVFEGHYRNGNSYEKRKHMKSVEFSVPTLNKKFNPHWAGFSMGFINFSDEGLQNINDVEGITLNSGSSLEYNLNILEKAVPFARNQVAFVTGLGIRWSRYRIANNKHIQEVDGVTSLVNAPNGIFYTKSKLNVNYFTIPLLFEWQPGYKKHRFFVSAGVVGTIKFSATSKVQYVCRDGRKQKDRLDRGLNVRPINMDVIVQTGYGPISAYARYSPFDMFESGKGPKVHPVAVGLQLNF